MNELGTSLLVLLLISVPVAAIVHWRVPRYMMACVIAAVASAILFQVAVLLQLGYLDPFFVIAFAVSLVPAFLAALVVGVPFVVKRRPADGTTAAE